MRFSLTIDEVPICKLQEYCGRYRCGSVIISSEVRRSAIKQFARLNI